MPSPRLWFEFASHLSGARNLICVGNPKSGGGFDGFYVEEGKPLRSAREFISGPGGANADLAARRLRLAPDGHRGVNWSGHLLKRQAYAAENRKVHADDRVDDLGYIPEAIGDVLTRAGEKARPTFAYVNHEAGMGSLAVAGMLKAVLPSDIPTMATGITDGEWPMFSRWGEVARSPGVCDGRPLCAMVDAWLAPDGVKFARYEGMRLGNLWNSMIDIINQVASARRKGLAAVPNLPGIGTIEGGGGTTPRPTTPREKAVYRLLAEAMVLMGVQDVVVFNRGGRGVHLKDPACDFASMLGEDLETTEAFEDRGPASGKWLPSEPIALDSERFKLGSPMGRELTFSIAGLPDSGRSAA